MLLEQLCSVVLSVDVSTQLFGGNIHSTLILFGTLQSQPECRLHLVKCEYTAEVCGYPSDTWQAGQRLWTILCDSTDSRDVSYRIALLLLWNLAPMRYLKEDGWVLQARSCGEIKNCRSVVEASLIYTGVVQHFWEIVDGRVFCLFVVLKTWSCSDKVCEVNRWSMSFRLFAGFRLWEYKFFVDNPTHSIRRGYWAWKLTKETGLNWALNSNHCLYWWWHNMCLTQTRCCTGQNLMKTCN